MKILLVSCFALASLVAACGSDDTGTTSGGTSGTSGTSGSSGGTDAATPPTTNSVVVKSNSFAPASLTVKVGDTVTWTWQGGNHDVVSGPNCTADGTFKSALQSAMGTTFTHTFDKAGSFEYFCTPHCASAGMKGTIVVQ